MQTIKVSKKEVEYKKFIKRPADETDFETLINEDALLVDEDGKKLCLYFKFQGDTTKVSDACKAIPYYTNGRSSGLISTSRIFGYDPATGIRKSFCSATALARDNPKEHSVITEFGKEIAKIYAEYLPEDFEKHQSITDEKIKDQWKIEGTPFTSGIINQNNQLNYHFDSGNFKEVYSNMIVFKKNTAGGHLALPEYNVGLQCADNTLVMFDGQSILHGVTPMKFLGGKTQSYRFSIVYYSLKSIWLCKDITEELANIRNRRSSIEKRNRNL